MKGHSITELNDDWHWKWVCDWVVLKNVQNDKCVWKLVHAKWKFFGTENDAVINKMKLIKEKNFDLKLWKNIMRFFAFKGISLNKKIIKIIAF